MSRCSVSMLTVVSVLLTVTAAWSDAACGGEGQSFTTQQLEQARMDRAERLELGARAVAVLENPGAAPEAKSNAALAIGQLAYAMGIAVLIERIDLKNPQEISGESDIGASWPCVRALADFGVAAMPALVRAYANETREDRRELFRYALIFGKAYAEAKTYTLGLISEVKEPAQRKALEELLKLIPAKEADDSK